MTDNQNQVLDAAAKIVADFGSHSRSAYFANFAESATFIFHTHNLRLDSRAEYEKLWDLWEKEDGFRVHGCKSANQLVQLFGVAFAVFSHEVESSVEFAGETSTVFEKETIVFEKQSSGWIAVHEHLSASSGS
jgi:hypothetical protein